MLSTKNTRSAEQEVLRSAREYLGISRNSSDRYVSANFEHGQWWIIFADNTSEDQPERTFSVYDSNGGVGFEEV